MRFAFRSLAHSPLFTLVAVITLALGIGANTAIFSVINGVLLRPLRYPEPERLMTIWESSKQSHLAHFPTPPGVFYDLKAQSVSFEALGAWTSNPLNLSGAGIEPERLEGAAVTEDFAAVLRVAPVLGRFFDAGEFTPGRDGVVIVSEAFWRQHFGGDPAVLGRTLQLNGRDRTVVGVMPAGFIAPNKSAAWVPYAPDAEFRVRRDWHLLRPIARLKPGVTYAQADEELQRLARQYAAKYSDTDADWTINAFPMLDDAVGKIRPALLLLVAAVGTLLLIACANVANLLLARAAARQREIAIRLSLGATRARIIGQLLGEALLLFAVGAAAGVLLANWGLEALLALAPRDLPRLDQISLDRTTLCFTTAITLLTGVTFGLVPAWQCSRADVKVALHNGERGSTARRGWLRSGFVVAQLAAAVGLLAVAGLLLRSFEQVRRVPLGFTPENVLVFRVDLPAAKFDSVEKSSRYIDDFVRAIEAVPGVAAAGATSAVPLEPGPMYIMRFAGRPPVTPSQAPIASQRVVTRDYFRAVGMTLQRGRWFGAQDMPGAPRVCLVNEALVQKYFPGRDPIGQRLEIGFDDPPAWREIVGVVADAKSDGLDATTPVQVFEPVHQWRINSFSIAVRSKQDPATLGPAIRMAARQFDPTQAIHSLRPLTQVVSESLAQRTFSLVLLATFAAVAFALAAIGLYGVVAYSVAQRTREFGVRLALGASGRDVLALVLRQGGGLIAAGIVIGLATAITASHLIQTLLFGVSAHDPATFVTIAGLLGAVALLACLIPALRAMRVDPVVALRVE